MKLANYKKPAKSIVIPMGLRSLLSEQRPFAPVTIAAINLVYSLSLRNYHLFFLAFSFFSVIYLFLFIVVFYSIL